MSLYLNSVVCCATPVTAVDDLVALATSRHLAHKTVKQPEVMYINIQGAFLSKKMSDISLLQKIICVGFIFIKLLRIEYSFGFMT